jgi:asparagine synthase (glutamine-hydrolysing)
MCGINIIIGDYPDSEVLIQEMMKSTVHRGPDFSAFSRVSEQVFFAGNRLKILDLTDASNQPLWNKEKDAVLAWNGAIYNYQDLRNELLDMGYIFQTNSDSEVLLYWLRAFGKEGIKKLKGMFAIAFADLRKKETLILRDPSGEKPIYFSNINNSWFFSSEARPLKLGPNKSLGINTDQFIPYFYQRHSYPNASFFEGIKQLLPGKGMRIDLQGNLLEDFSWTHPPFQKLPKNQHTFEELLKDAVLKNFHTERRVGTILSGGADSSLIYALWYEETGEPIPSYTVSFDKSRQSKYSDPSFTKKLGNKYPTLAHEVVVDLDKVKKNWKAYIETLDQPVGDSASFLTWITAKEAASNVQVLLSGAGADELFGGYNRHLAYQRYLQNTGFWGLLKKSGISKILPDSPKKMIESIEKDPSSTFIQMSALQNIPESLLQEFHNWYPKGNSLIKNALEWDRSFYLINDILKIHDNACMAHGIEGRAPYLDFDLISLSQSLSEEENSSILGKTWIKEALKKRGLGFIAKRKKLGFGLPLKEWMSQEAYLSWVCPPIEKMSSQWGHLFPQEMRTLSQRPRNAKGRQYLQIWNLFVLASWLEIQRI